jgi:HEAT repeat protein
MDHAIDLLNAFDNDFTVEHIQTVFEQLLPTDDPETLNFVTHYLFAPTPVVCEAAAHMLARCKNLAAAEAIGACLHTGDSKTQYAFSALEKIGLPAFPMLDSFLSSTDPNLRRSACEVLGKIGSPDSVEKLTPLLEDPDFTVIEVAAQALAHLKQQSAVPALIDALTTPSIWARIAVIAALGQLGGTQALQALCNISDQASEIEIGAAIEAIASAGQAEPQMALRYLLGKIISPNSYLSETALLAYSGFISKNISIPNEVQKYLISIIEDRTECAKSELKIYAVNPGELKFSRAKLIENTTVLGCCQLLKCLASTAQGDVRDQAISGLIDIGYYSLDNLSELACLEDLSIKVRLAAVHQIELQCNPLPQVDKKVVKTMNLLTHPDQETTIRLAAALFLCQKDPDNGSLLLTQLLSQANGSSLDPMLAELKNFSTRELLRLISESDQESENLPRLLQLLDTPQRMKEIAELNDGKALLISCMGHSHWQVRVQTVRLLSYLPFEWSLRLIHHACMDYNTEVRYQAIEIVQRQLKL